MQNGVIASPERTSPRRFPYLAWGVILLCAGLVAYRQASPPAGAREGLDLATFQIQARLFVGLTRFPGQTPERVYQQAVRLNRGPYGQRLGFVVLAGELAGPAEARRLLPELDAAWREAHPGEPPPPEESRLAALLDRLYRGYEEGKPPEDALPTDDRDELLRRMGWLGALALAPPAVDAPARESVLAPARRAAIAFTAFGFAAVLAVALGVALLTLAVVLAAAGGLRPRFTAGSPYGNVYAETFAAWMVLFLALIFLARFVPVADRWRMTVSNAASLASLAALAWPRVRGVPWGRLRRDVGLYLGNRPAAEAGLGVAGYVATLPLLALGVVAMLGLMKLSGAFGPHHPFAPEEGPTHPIVGPLSRGDWWVRVQVLVAAAVIAPLVEETMFRGVLYRHLRESSAGLGRLGSAAVSAAAVALVFAGIHPQGWMGVPPLAALAFGFALLREWRGSLLPAMAAHGLNNAALTLLMIVAFA